MAMPEADAYCSLFVCIFVLMATASWRAERLAFGKAFRLSAQRLRITRLSGLSVPLKFQVLKAMAAPIERGRPSASRPENSCALEMNMEEELKVKGAPLSEPLSEPQEAVVRRALLLPVEPRSPSSCSPSPAPWDPGALSGAESSPGALTKSLSFP